jgi:hypothetical protein
LFYSSDDAVLQVKQIFSYGCGIKITHGFLRLVTVNLARTWRQHFRI